MSFLKFKKVIQKRLDYLIKKSDQLLFIVDIERDELWNKYINSFRPEDDPIYVTETTHTCNADKSWIKACGGIVAIINNEMHSIWDVKAEDGYQIVCDKLNEFVLNAKIKDQFLISEIVGKDKSIAINEFRVVKNLDGSYSQTKEKCPKFGKTFHHFYYEFSHSFIVSNVVERRSIVRQSKDLLKRSFDELTTESVEIVIELIEDKVLYRGEEHLKRLKEFRKLQAEYLVHDKPELFCWLTAVNSGRLGAIRNSAIGTLLTNLSEGIDLEIAVKKYESVVAPSNYKRPKAIYTKFMKDAALKTVTELGLLNSLDTRYAQLEDIDIKNVLWASGDAQQRMKTPFDLLGNGNASLSPNKNVTELNVEEFISDVLPNSKKVEVLFENKHQPNLVSLLSQSDLSASSLVKWDNGFRWSYNGGFADSAIKEAVKMAGGDVSGDLNFRLAWNIDNIGDESDLDAWARESNGHKIGYNTKYNAKGGKSRLRSRFTGQLDVDNTRPGGKIAVENITWKNLANANTEIKLWVHQYKARNSKGFVAEIEFNGEVYTFNYDRPVSGKVDVATITVKDGKISIQGAFRSEQSSKEIWGLNTQQYAEVSSVMLSPNYWDYGKGNLHYFFLLQDCVNPDNPRSFYNEFLKGDLNPHRKVFEALGDKMRVAHTNNQLSGLGFSSTQNNNLLIKVDNRPYNLKFNTNEKFISKSAIRKMEVSND